MIALSYHQLCAEWQEIATLLIHATSTNAVDRGGGGGDLAGLVHYQIYFTAGYLSLRSMRKCALIMKSPLPSQHSPW